jgi:hypothetical protein
MLLLVILSERYFYRTYIGGNTTNALSDKTLEIMSALKSPLEIYVIIEDSGSSAVDSVRKDVTRLLNEYADCVHGNGVKIEFVTPTDARSKNLVETTVFLPANAILLKHAGKRKIFAIEELYDVRNGEIARFRGERILTNAIRDLATEKRKIVYFLTGHGEYDIADTSPASGLSTLANLLRAKNYDVRCLDFSSTSGIPDDVDLLVIWGPKVPLLAAEMASLCKFLDEHGGKIVLGLTGTNDVALADFFADHGIRVNLRSKIFFPHDSAKVGHDFVVKKYAQHKITNELINFKMPIVCGEIYEAREADWTADDDKFLVTDLLQIDGISNDSDGENKFVVAAISEKRMPIDVGILAGKLLVFGCSDFAINSRINILGNSMLMRGAVDYMCNVSDDIDIMSSPIRSYRLILTVKQYYSIVILGFTACGIFAALGVVVYLLRRK